MMTKLWIQYWLLQVNFQKLMTISPFIANLLVHGIWSLERPDVINVSFYVMCNIPVFHISFLDYERLSSSIFLSYCCFFLLIWSSKNKCVHTNHSWECLCLSGIWHSATIFCQNMFAFAFFFSLFIDLIILMVLLHEFDASATQ